LAVLASTCPMISAAQPEQPLTSLALHVGFVRTFFLNVNRPDAEAAFKGMAEVIGRERGYRISTDVQIFDSASQIESAVRSSSLNLAILDSWNYVSIPVNGRFLPCFVTAENGQAGKKYLVLTRRESGLKTLADLRGREITEPEVASCNAGGAWLETLLLQNHLGLATNFFGKVTFANKPALVVLPVFFGKQAACLIDASSYALMGELNPQVEKELLPIAESPVYVDNVICLRTNSWDSEKIQRDLTEALGDLHKEPAGQQMLTLFKVSQLVPYKTEQLATVRQLRAQFDELRQEPQAPIQSVATAQSQSATKP
jgi:phosphonate transport system substrate-binding protein